MDISAAGSTPHFDDHRGARQHRYMESSDINAVFRAFFGPLRTNVRRGMSIGGQLYGIEMDDCIPGEMLSTTWIPPAARGIDDQSVLADVARRAAIFSRLLAEPRREALYAYVCEHDDEDEPPPRLVVEIVSADARYGAEYPIFRGRGWHRRDLVQSPHRLLGRVVLA